MLLCNDTFSMQMVLLSFAAKSSLNAFQNSVSVAVLVTCLLTFVVLQMTEHFV